jgi:CRP/FNR family transcriptional regulator
VRNTEPTGTNSISQILDCYEFFRDGSNELRETVLNLAKHHKQTERGKKTLYLAWEKPAGVFFVGSGSIRVFVAGHSGRNVTLYHVQPGELCPVNLRAVMNGGVSLASAEFSGDFSVAVIGFAGYKQLIKDYDRFRALVIESVTARFEDVIRQIADVTTRTVDYRISQFLVQATEGEGHGGLVMVTNDEIADEIGATRESVNRKLRALQRVGIVALGRGQIRLLQREKLQRTKSSSGK